jgi:hypothetical protein
MQDKKIKELEEMVVRLQNQINDLAGNFYRNNFTSSQTFNKACIFADRLKVPSFDSAPSVAEVNDIMGINGELYICTAINPVAWTLVGSQS